MILAAVSGLLVGVGVNASPAVATDSTPNRIDLRVLVLSDGGANTEAVATALGREGVPTTTIQLGASGRPVINDAFLENAATHEGNYQAIVVPSTSDIGADELAALTSYEQRYGVRQVDAFVYPGAGFGLNPPALAGTLDGSPLTVTPAGTAGPFSYLSGSLKVDDFSPTTAEAYGYVASPVSPQPAGQTFTPLINVTSGGSTGSFIGEFTHAGHQELVVTAAFNANQQFFLEIAHGIVTWATRGVHLGYQRNYFAVHTDDVFLADSRWSSVGHCTPGDDCYGADSTLTTPDIRMVPSDVTDLVAWQNAHDFKFDMIFNGGGSDDYIANNEGTTTDPLADAYTANASQFTFINHTYSHPFLGCVQIAPSVAGDPWHCETQTDHNDPSVVYIDPTVHTPTNETYDSATGFWYASQALIESQVSQNLTWASAHGLTVDPTQVVTGEHSGLAILPQQPSDNPFLAPALQELGITTLASDASREATARSVGGVATTVPRHPMNVFYNVATYPDEVNEYNWLYTSQADGGSGICTTHSDTTTCIAPLPNDTAADSKNSFDTYIVPTEVRNALSFVLSNDPRPFYVHQSNFTEQQIIYPVVGDILTDYRAVYAASAPLVHLDLHGQSAALSQMTAWNAQAPQVTAYIDSAGVHVQGNGSASVPLTVPTDATTHGVTLAAYGGEQSGWISQPSSDTVVATPGTTNAGYVGTPDAPTIGIATAGNASATVTWTAPARDNGSAITSYLVQAYLAGQTTPATSVTAPATATSATVTGLGNFNNYEFTVSAINAVGTSPASIRSNVVEPLAATPAAPAAPVATRGNASATITWVAPNNGGTPITGYTIKAYLPGATVWALSTTAPAGATSTTMTGLTNGSTYRFTVTAANAVGVGAESPKSNAVTPAATVPGAPTIGTATGGPKSATVTWTAPADTGGSAITAYVVREYKAGSTNAAATATVAATATSASFTGLTAGVSYTFTVTARNAVGAGPASAASNAVVPTGTPAAPTISGVTTGDSTATVTWTAPTSDGGQPITSYIVNEYAAGTTTPLNSSTVDASVRSLTVALTPGTAVYFTVSAVNSVGTGTASARSARVTGVTKPGAPIIGTATGSTRGRLTAVARWSAPSYNGSSPITGYVVTATSYAADGTTPGSSVSSTQQAAGSRSLTMTLPVGNYKFTVVAINALGTSPASSPSNLVVVS